MSLCRRSPPVRNVPEGITTSSSVPQASNAACRLKVFSVFPSPTAPKSRTFKMRGVFPVVMRTLPSSSPPMLTLRAYSVSGQRSSKVQWVRWTCCTPRPSMFTSYTAPAGACSGCSHQSVSSVSDAQKYSSICRILLKTLFPGPLRPSGAGTVHHPKAERYGASAGPPAFPRAIPGTVFPSRT